MSILEGIKEYFKERRLKRLEMDIYALRNRLNFDPRFSLLDGDPQTEEAFTRRISEYKVWSMGNTSVIRRFYHGMTGEKNRSAFNKLNYFWAKAPITARMVHSGIPGLISTRMADILFGNGVKASVVVYKDGSGDNLKEDTAAMRKAEELMSVLLGAIDFQNKIQTAATNESWGGHCFFKLSHDVDISNFPILETYDVTEAEVVKARGITKAIIFKSWYTDKNVQYRLDEVYSTTKKGDACISYHLYRRMSDGEKEVDLLSIPQTARLFKVNGKGAADGISLDENNTIVYEGLKGMLAFEKPNKTPSLEFPSSDYGASDYEGAVDCFDALDEIVSGNIHEIRTNKTRRYIPSAFLPHDPNDPKEVLPFDDFDDSYVRHEDDPDQDAKSEIKVVRVDDKTESFINKWKSVLSTICNKAKISPYSLGITWLEAVGPSADSLRERNKTTIDMRAGKLGLWKPLLEEMLLRILQMYAWMLSHTDMDKSGLPEIPFAWENTTVRVEFGDYIEDTYRDMLPLMGAAKSQHVVSTKECVERLHPDWTEARRQEEINLIRFEEGMSADNPMSLPTLTGLEE